MEHPRSLVSRASAWLSRVTDIALVGLVLFVGAYYYHQWPQAKSPDKADTTYKVGQRIDLTAFGLQDGQPTLLLAVRTTCFACTASVPFYGRLMSLQDQRARIVVVGMEEPHVLREYLAQHQLRPDAVVSTRELHGLQVTPTVLLLDSSGAIEAVWKGRLSEQQEVEVTAELSKSQ